MIKFVSGIVLYFGYINVFINFYSLLKGKGVIVVVIDNIVNFNREKLILVYEINIDVYYLYEVKVNLGESYIF